MGMITKVRIVKSRKCCERVSVYACVLMLGVGEGWPRKMSYSLDMLSSISCSMSLWRFGLKQARSGIQDHKSGGTLESG